MVAMTLYRDRWIVCDEDGITVRAYYFPWGTKRIPYKAIRSAVVVPMGFGSGRGRIWGTTNLRLWASLDPHRGWKKRALILDLGRQVRPFLTPDDVDAVAEIIRRKTGVPISSNGNGRIV
jgi:hypothetical protein